MKHKRIRTPYQAIRVKKRLLDGMMSTGYFKSHGSSRSYGYFELYPKAGGVVESDVECSSFLLYVSGPGGYRCIHAGNDIDEVIEKLRVYNEIPYHHFWWNEFNEFQRGFYSDKPTESDLQRVGRL